MTVWSIRLDTFFHYSSDKTSDFDEIDDNCVVRHSMASTTTDDLREMTSLFRTSIWMCYGGYYKYSTWTFKRTTTRHKRWPHCWKCTTTTFCFVFDHGTAIGRTKYICISITRWKWVYLPSLGWHDVFAWCGKLYIHKSSWLQFLDTLL